MFKKLFLIFSFSFFAFAYAASDLYSFKNSEDKTRFYNLTSELRCLVCQNQTLADSNAPLANDLRGEVYHQIQQGQSDQAIIDYLVARYGDFILYRPPVNKLTILLWLGPFLILITGLGYLFYYLYRNHKRDLP